MKNTKWLCKHFNDLSNEELYEIFRLRIEVFVVEQNCPYQDADRKDYKGFHLMGYDINQTLIAYARILPEGISYKEVSIGRVITSPVARKTGAGKSLMQKAMEIIKEKYGNVAIRIGAQEYLHTFYNGFGFKKVSETYLEDNIPHIEMLFIPR
ncbi:MAG TPA: GNAT family N-acetyltransferase [Bacteroidia bacterium]|nr:GNAT family N-acetyltransferase [Bacteroidia bacterium]